VLVHLALVEVCVGFKKVNLFSYPNSFFVYGVGQNTIKYVNGQHLHFTIFVTKKCLNALVKDDGNHIYIP
jgi:hypothetical protein